MKKSLLITLAMMVAGLSFGQLTGNKAIPGTPPTGYATIAAAVADLNTQGVGTGGVTFNVAAGYTENITAPLQITATGTAANPIVFQKSGAGGNPVVTRTDAGSSTTSTFGGLGDAIVRLDGTDYITFDAINVTATNSTIEYGYLTYKPNGTDGCQNVTVKNTTITMNKAGVYVIGIYMSNGPTLVSSATGVTVTAASGTNANNQFYGNTLTNVYHGICLYGYAASSPYDLYDQNNSVGIAASGNTFTNFAGGSSTAYVIYNIYQNGLSVMNNSINGGTGQTGALYGIYGSTATNANADFSGNTITLVSAGTTGYMYGIYNSGIGTSGTNNTLNIYNNTVQNCTYPTATSAYFYGIYNAATAFNINMYGNTVNNNVLAGSAYNYLFYTTTGASTTANVYNNTISNNSRTGNSSTCYQYGMYLVGSGSYSIHDNSVFGNTLSGLTSVSGYNHGIYCSNSAISQTVYNNTVHDQTITSSYTSGSGMYGIYSYPGSAGVNTNAIYNNNIYNLTISNTSSGYGYIYGIYGYYMGQNYSNTVYNLTVNSATGYGYSYGFYVGGAGTFSVYKNKLYGVSMAGASGYFYGMYVTGVTTANIYNNYIYDLKALGSTSLTANSAIYISSGTTVNLSYNTVYLNASSTSATTFSTSALYVYSTTPAVTCRNNIFVNTSTPGPTGGFAAAFRYTAAPSTSSYTTASNNNLFYAGTPAANKLIYGEGQLTTPSNPQQTLDAYKTYIGNGRDASSVTENPPFINVATLPYDLHLSTSTATQCESGGSIISSPISITTDYDDQARYPNPGYPDNVLSPATAPDIGADEFAGLFLDVNPPTISFTPLMNTSSTTARTLTTTITDPSGVPTSGIGLPRLYYKINAGAWQNVVAAPPVGNQYQFTFGGGVVLGDVISYYIVAQDNYTPINVGSNPSAGASGFTANPPACTTPPTTPYTYTIVGTICGTFNVGAGQTYTTLTAAIADLNNKEMTCPVTFLLTDASYTAAETFPIVINANPGSSTTNILTIKPATGVTATISGAASASALIRVLNPNTVIDGSNSVGGTSKDLTISNTSTTTPQVIFAGSTGTVTMTGLTIKNNVLINGINSSSALVLTSSDGSAGYFNDVTIQNNDIQLAYIGIYFMSAVASGNGSGLLITGNTLSSTVNPIRLCAIYVQGADGATVTNNTIGNMPNTVDASNLTGIWFATGTTNSTISGNTISTMSGTSTGPRGIAISSAVSNANVMVEGNTITDLSTSSSVIPYGIYVFSTTTGVTVKNNKVGTLLNSNTGGYGARGIYVVTNIAASNIDLINNAVYDIKCTSDASLTYWCIGIGMEGTTGGVNVYHNSVNLSGTYAGYSSATIATALYIGTSATNIDVRDNILVNTYDNTGSTTDKAYAIYCGTTNAAFTNINYNDYFVSGTPGILGYLGADQTTLAAWQTATTQDGASQNMDPTFVSSTDLHPTNLSLDHLGYYLTTVPTDITGALRTNPPDMGAYEFGTNPAVVTTAASSIMAYTATLNGTINANSYIVSSYFDYGLTTSYGTSIAGVPASVTGTTTTPISLAISGLTASTTYNYRARGVTSTGVTVYGNNMTFTTTGPPPTVVTTAASSITTAGATLNGTVNANGSSSTVTFEYGPTITYGSTVTATQSPVGGSTVTPVSAPITGLAPNTQYHFRVKGVNAGGTSNGNDMTFTTAAAPPIVVTNAATNIGTTTATLNGTVTAQNASTTVTFQWGLSPSFGNVATATPSPVTGNTATAVSANITGLTPNTLYYFRCVGVNAGGTTNGTTLSFLAGCPPIPQAGTITGPTSVCANSTGNVYSITALTNATGYTWSVPAGATITSGANTTSITVTFGTTSGNVSVYGTSACTSGAPNSLAVTVNALPTPTITGPSTACTNTAGNIYTTQAGMSNYVWTVSAGGTITAGSTSNAITVTWNTAGAQSVTVNYTNANGCTAATPTSYPVTVNARPTPTLTGPNNVCATTTGNVYTTQSGMTNYAWTVSAGGTVTAGGTSTSNTVTVTWNTAGAQTVTVNYANASGCTSTSPTTYAVTVNALPSPSINGDYYPCVGTQYVDYYTEGGMSNYQWTVSAGGSIYSGQGTSHLRVIWNTSGAQSLSINYINASGCTLAVPYSADIFVSPVPGVAGTITGTATVCAGQQGVAYSTTPVMNATSYTWTLPAGATIASGTGTNSITVNFGTNASSGSITVAGTNDCGSGTPSAPFAVTVNPLPAGAGTISGPTPVCQGETGVVYSVATIANATGYAWTLPAGATITAGNNTKQITVSFSASASSGVITVHGTNACGSGESSPDFDVTVNPVPPTPVITESGGILTSSAPSGNQWYFNDVLIPGATGQTYEATESGDYFVIVTINSCSSEPSNIINVVISGISHHSGTSINVFPVPNEGMFTVIGTWIMDEPITLEVYNYLGVKIFDMGILPLQGKIEQTVDLRPAPNGVYTVILRTSDNKVIRRILVNK